MANIYGDRPAQTWTDPDTGVVYNAATMTPLPTAGRDLGELPGRSKELDELTSEEPDGFAALLGIEPEKD